MMNALDFIKTFRRMCKETKDCSMCPVNKNDFTCEEILSVGVVDVLDTDEIERIIDIIEEWNKEHPTKTRLTEIQKLFPHITADSCPGCLKRDVPSQNCCIIDCSKCKEEFWNAEI